MSEPRTIKSGSIEPGILYVDHREPEKMKNFIADQCTVPVEIVTLETGDYVMGSIAIERKTIGDLAMSMMSKKNSTGRLWTQKERLVRDFDKKIVLVSGDFDDLVIKVNEHAVLGAIARLMADGVDICFGLGNDEHLAYLVLKIFEKNGLLKMVPVRPKKIGRRK